MENFVDFLLRAKRETYAAGGDLSTPSRPNSKDLRYTEGPFEYIDTYLGDIDFIGEEAVWKDGQALWGMNYYGWMKVDKIPKGFSKCLKGALLAVPREAPFRGPEEFHSDDFTFRCQWDGDVSRFTGREEIFHKGVSIYELVFHGGRVKSI
jgi:hypothetical protein